METRAINLLHFETLIATKAARCVLAADGKAILVDFGLRRAHGAEAGLLAARATRIAGFAGTSTVLAGARYGIPIFGTMAHSYIEAHENEEEAFLAYARANPANVTLLIDTYDTSGAPVMLPRPQRSSPPRESGRAPYAWTAAISSPCRRRSVRFSIKTASGTCRSS